MSVLIVIPWRGGCEHRERALSWVLGKWHNLGFEPMVVELPEGPWRKADVMPCIAASQYRTVVVADADVWSDGITEAILEVECGRAWAIPHLHVRRLTEKSTLNVLAGDNPDELGTNLLAEQPYVGIAGGGLVVLRHDVALDVPLDPRFEGWGGEDHSWGYALETLYGTPWRGTKSLTHFWHPPQPRASRKVGNATSEALRRRYRDARGDPQAMRRIIEECRGSQDVHPEPQSHQGVAAVR